MLGAMGHSLGLSLSRKCFENPLFFAVPMEEIRQESVTPPHDTDEDDNSTPPPPVLMDQTKSGAGTSSSLSGASAPGDLRSNGAVSISPPVPSLEPCNGPPTSSGGLIVNSGGPPSLLPSVVTSETTGM